MDNPSCNSRSHFSRRTILKLAGLSGIGWLTPLAGQLARADEANPRKKARSLIVLWLAGAPSQLETFDPHPGTDIAAGSLAIKTKAPGVLIGDGFPRLADQMDSVSLIRAITSKEGDHERAVYNIKTGYRPDPTLNHPSIGSVICHQTMDGRDRIVSIPRHISILPGQWPGRGGYLGDRYDAFKVFDPQRQVPDVAARVDERRQGSRLKKLQFADKQFLQGRQNNKVVGDTLQHSNLDLALNMMSSEQLNAFDVSKSSIADRAKFGETPFGRSCLAAIQLITAGVRCVEITLNGWDTHANNHALQKGRIDILDPAFAAMIAELKKRELFDSTMVVCGGEFGRTPWVNPVGGRDHWPHGFSVAVAGGGIQGGRVIGETNPDPKRGSKNPTKDLKDPHTIADVHATILHGLGIDYGQELDTPIGRPMKVCEGQPILQLFERA
jgi:uncharacterized protein (DUF1501 family)